MGRSKFPGKPTKHVNRKRVNVLSTPFGTTVGDINAVVTVETDNSKKIDAACNEGAGITTKASANSNLKIGRKISKKKRARLVNKRGNLKRTGMLSTGINQVTRRTRSAVAGRRSIRSFSSIRKVSKPKNPCSPTKESTNLVGKFVLPSRSVHSSRVIKPNKRFIHVEPNDARTFKKCVVSKRLSAHTTADKCKIESDNAKPFLVDSIRTVRETRDNSPVRVLHSNGKVVLRQARLQLHTQTATTGSEGPFSCNSSNNVSPPGTVTCGVCGAVRFYRFVKQARKFNIYSCESCRKFISKMIKRQNNMNSNTLVLVCQKGQGMCHVPPIVRSQHWKLFRCAYRARCPACWLKMCLRSFQMPIALKNNLAQLLPKNMQTYDLLFSSPLPLLSWQANVEKKSDESPSTPKSDEVVGQPVRRRPVRFKPVKRDEKPISSAHISVIKRQKVDLKGPRVKHVCRSASIVLGQPIATFPGDSTKRNSESSDAEKLVDKTVTLKENNEELNSDECISISSSEYKQFSSSVKYSTSKQGMLGKKERISKNMPFSNSVSEQNTFLLHMKKNFQECGKTISIDFWENYNPDEVCKNGFGLIASEPFPIQAICFLCGSAGQEALLHCLICCEPYHPYCLEPMPFDFTKHNGKYSWLCPRCTTCNACGEAYRQKINCQKCHKAYHPQCFNTFGKREDKPMVCSSCLRCRNCDTNNITKFIGNLALCLACFKLRKKENLCPVCKQCHSDDFDAKVMECGKCKKLVHAKCESLTDEQYQILSFLPDSVEFLCQVCSSTTTPYWREIVHSELKTNFLNVLRLLGKNRVARNFLKLSPYKESVVVCARPPVSVRKIQFRDDDVNVIETQNGDRELFRQTSLESQDGNADSSKLESKLPALPTIVDIKKKLNSNEYVSLHEFNTCMEHALCGADSEELLKIYRTILKKIFPFYDPTHWKENDGTSNLLSKDMLHTQCSALNSIVPTDKDNKSDTRMCGLCKGVGDGLAHKESRLLYCGQNEWVHANCALWSSEVYEEIDGSLQNVHSAISRSKSIKCSYCKQRGASVGCCLKGCHESYHFVCAQNANCYFLHDKTTYCRTHNLDDKLGFLTSPSDFYILRSVYVEIDRKKKKYSEPDKVHFMVGCLSVTSLGKVVPLISDDFDALIPSGFLCSRLFWSTTEPWKLVRYNISTSTLNPEMSNMHVDKNYTVDHSFPKDIVERELKEILTWQKDISKEVVDSEYEEEPQNTVDLLSPELTDAIFEELPHDFLDGISVQDMLMSYEELLNMDFKSEINCNDTVSLNMNEHIKKINDAPDDIDSDTKCYKELKRSKSEVFNQLGTVDKLSKNRGQQRSCSLTWSCKLDSSLTPAMKKRKIASRDNNMYLQLLQVDGACDSSSGSDSESPMNEAMESSEEPVSCERCQCTYRTRASYKRHLGTCDALSTSESDSEEESVLVKADNSILVNVAEPTEPNTVTSFESYSSYQASQNEMHSTVLNTQTIMSSETTSDVITVPESVNIFHSNFQQPISATQSQPHNVAVRQASLPINQSQTQLGDPNQTATNSYSINQTQLSANQHPTFCINQQPICFNQPNTLSINPSGIISLDNSSLALNQAIPLSININQQAPISINQTTPLSLNQAVEMQPPMTIQSIPFTQEVTPILNIAPNNQITIDAKMLTAPCSNIVNTVSVPQSQWMKPMVKPPVMTHKTIRPRGKPRSLLAKRSRIQPGGAVVMSQSNSVVPPVIVQHVPSSNMVPAFVDAFQQQTGQNLQYVATITPQINTTIGPQTQLLQLQPNSNILSLVSGVQPTMIFQQPRVIADQLIVDSNGSLMWATQPVQPVYYGFETIVQNTVMQSQQFLPSTVPGVLTTNSSYSATTQVFQTSKLEPVLDVPTGSIVLLNSSQLVNPTTTIQLPHQMSHPTVSENIPSANQLPATQVSNHSKPNWHPVQPPQTVREIITQPKPPAVPPPTVSNNIHSITLPLAPFVSEQGIPTNIVTPTPKPPISAQARPMSRVLPMQTNAPREQKKPIEEKILTGKEIVDICNKETVTPTLVKVNVDEKPDEKMVICEKVQEEISKSDEQQLKLILHKQKQDWKTESNTPPKVVSPIQIVPLKPIKSTCIDQSLPEVTEDKSEVKPVESCPSYNHKSVTAESERKVPQQKVGNKNIPSILYTIETLEGFHYSSTSIYELWSKVFEAVQGARAAHSMAPLPANALDLINNLQLLGLKTNGLRYLLEQLPGASKCTKYKPSYYSRSSQDDSDDDIDTSNSCGSVRSLPYVRKKEPNDMFGWLASKHRKPENSLVDSDLLPRRGGSVTNLPMAMRFRQLKLTSKVSVGVYRSGIHRRGLFSLRDIESGEMVIEYAGEVIRSVLTDKREKHYNSKGIGCYMFRIDDNLVVDATMKGNAARFINHSCDPNCYSKVVEIHGHKHIIIFALRRILCGEELTYDYKFPFEEDKIPCTCGARRCRKFLN